MFSILLQTNQATLNNDLPKKHFWSGRSSSSDLDREGIDIADGRIGPPTIAISLKLCQLK